MRPTRSSMTSVSGSLDPYFTAFSHRFQTICRSCDGSTWTSTSPSSEVICEPRRGVICMVALNSSRKPSSQAVSIRRSGREFSRRAMDMTFSMICRTRSPLVRTISVSRLSSSDRDRGFREQLRRMAHGAHGIADLMGDARGKPAEPGQLGLLDLGGQQLGVFEENDDRRRFATTERREVRLDDVAAIGGDEGLRGRRGVGGVLPPGFEQIEQLWRSLTEQRARKGTAITKHMSRGLVDQADAVLMVHHDDAFAQVLHDVLRKLGEIGEVHLLAPHCGFRVPQPRGQRPRQQRHQEHDAADDARGYDSRNVGASP